MALSRRGSTRGEAPIWPGFVDAMTSLLLVLLFVLTIFMMVQSVLRETIDTQGSELDALNAQVAELADALGLERSRADGLREEVGRLGSALTAAEAEGQAQAAAILALNGQLAERAAALGAANAKITDFEAQVAALLSERDAARSDVVALQAATETLRGEQDALNAALAAARSEIDAQTEAARLAAARREALEALTADLRRQAAEAEVNLSDALARLQASDGLRARVTAERDRLAEDAAALGTARDEAERARLAEAAAAEALRRELAASKGALSEAERTRLADLAAAEALRRKLADADNELTAMTLALEESRKRAEDTLTLLAAAETAQTDATKSAALNAGLLDAARKVLTDKDRAILEERRRVALLNEQIKALRNQLGSLQALLDASSARDAEAKVQLDTLGSQLNAALAQVASESSRRLALEEAERKRLEAEKANLEKFRSEFFGQLSQLLAGREGVRVVGDRFVFSSEVLFNPGSADLAPEGQAQIRSVVQILDDVAAQIPPGIDWIIRVDGHTDNVPLSGAGAFADNWQLSQARALSVVRYMQDVLRFPPNRMAATGFGEWQPVAVGDSADARAQNRRIEMKLTER